MQFPALKTAEDKLKKIFAEAGPNVDLEQVKSIDGTRAEKLAEIRRLNDEIADLKATDSQVRSALSGGTPGGHESGDDRGSKNWVPTDPNRPAELKSNQRVCDWLTTTGVETYDQEFRLGYLGAHLKALMGNPRPLAEYRTSLTGEVKDMLSAGSAELIPEPISSELIDALRAVSTVFASGATTVPMPSATLVVPRVTSDPTPTWEAEGATVAPTDAAVDGVTLTARRLTALTKVSQELAEDSDPVSVGRVLNRSMAAAFSVEVDRVALRGSGTAPEPEGVRNQTGVTITAIAAAADWNTLADLAAAVQGANAMPTGFIWSTRTANAVGKTAASDGHYVRPPEHIAAIPRRATTAVPVDLGAGSDSEIYCGQWSELMVGMRIGFELRTLDQRFADEGKLGVIGRMRVDVQLRHGVAFAVATGVTN